MTVLAVIGVLAVMFGTAAIAVRDEVALVDAPPDRPELTLPMDRPVAADDLAQLRFGLALRGYRMAEVDAVLDRMGHELRERDERLAVLTAELDHRGSAGPSAGAAAAASPTAAVAPES